LVQVSEKTFTSIVGTLGSLHKFWKRKENHQGKLTETKSVRSDLIKSITDLTLHVVLDPLKTSLHHDSETLLLQVQRRNVLRPPMYTVKNYNTTA